MRQDGARRKASGNGQTSFSSYRLSRACRFLRTVLGRVCRIVAVWPPEDCYRRLPSIFITIRHNPWISEDLTQFLKHRIVARPNCKLSDSFLRNSQSGSKFGVGAEELSRNYAHLASFAIFAVYFVSNAIRQGSVEESRQGTCL